MPAFKNSPASHRVRITGRKRKFDPQFNFLLEVDPGFAEWQPLAAEWFRGQKSPAMKQTALVGFFISYMHNQGLDKRPESIFNGGIALSDLQEYLEHRLGVNSNSARQYHDYVSDFLDWVLKKRFAISNQDGHLVIPLHLSNPFPRKIHHGGKANRIMGTNLVFDPDFNFLVELNPGFADWKALAADWFRGQKDRLSKRTALITFFIAYLHAENLDMRPEAIFDGSVALPNLENTIGKHRGLNTISAKSYYNHISDFLDWVLSDLLAKSDEVGSLTAPSNLANPFPRKSRRRDGRSTDVTYGHIRLLDGAMNDWCDLAQHWMSAQIDARGAKHAALCKFLENYIILLNLPRDPLQFLTRDKPLPDFLPVLIESKKSHEVGDEAKYKDVSLANYIVDFLDWILSERFSVVIDNHKVTPAQLYNPLLRHSYTGRNGGRNESARSPLSIRHIKELRRILAAGPMFRDWHWAQQATDLGTGCEWFRVDPNLIKEDDQDCVWRKRKPTKWERKHKGLPEEITEIWSPVRAVALYIKLELPLRTIQVRLLDSGEADTWRYDPTPHSGAFVLNPSGLAMGSEKRPHQRGVFHRSVHEPGSAGLFVNTNKTADIGKDEDSKGYVIPWAHPEVLYWLQKLRNWQERFNPLVEPTSWCSLERKHYGSALPHETVLRARGSACFLFRDASAEGGDRKKPIGSASLDTIWYKLLAELEDGCFTRGETLDDGSPIHFVDRARQYPYYTPHALRVSLISYLLLDLKMPLEIVSKLIAGHSRIIMTLYYTKFGHSFMREVLHDAERREFGADQQNHARWLKDASIEMLERGVAHLSVDSLQAVLAQKSTASFIFDDKGICPVGSTMCDVGGESHGSTFLPVPGWPQERNCVRCRFFLTSPAFLPGLQARFNQLSYLAFECAERHNELQGQVNALENYRVDCELSGQAFTEGLKLQGIHQRYEAETEALGKLVNDLQATYHLMRRCLNILNNETAGGLHLVATGSITDLQVGLLETPSVLHQLEVICENAVIYPEIDARKPTLERGKLLDCMLENNGLPPVFFKLTQQQQLAAGNSLMRLIQARSGSFSGALDFVEGSRRLQEIGLLEDAYDAMSEMLTGTSAQKIIEAAKAHLQRRKHEGNYVEFEQLHLQ